MGTDGQKKEELLQKLPLNQERSDFKAQRTEKNIYSHQ